VADGGRAASVGSDVAGRIVAVEVGGSVDDGVKVVGLAQALRKMLKKSR
jgi:hypothetical protein